MEHSLDPERIVYVALPTSACLFLMRKQETIRMLSNSGRSCMMSALRQQKTSICMVFVS